MLTAPAAISWGEDVLVQPDVFVVPVEQARMLESSGIRDLLLVAEVLSPSTPGHDRFTKRRRYQEARVPLYWILDGDARQVSVHRAAAGRYSSASRSSISSTNGRGSARRKPVSTGVTPRMRSARKWRTAPRSRSQASRYQTGMLR